jgi:anaerobic magnesium-protoporphyrin IX monomethyl ester cyclase
MIFLTHGYFLKEDAREQLIMKPYAPLGILYISAYLEERGIENTIYDSTFSSFEQLQGELVKTKPPLVALYTNLMTKLNILKIISFIRSNLKDTKVVLGGPEIRHYSREYLEYGADLVVIGEGEETMHEICVCMKNTGRLPEDCHGTALLKNGELVTNEERTLIKDINSLPFPGRNKIDLGQYLHTWKKFHGRSMISVSTMRGCPYTCKWCSRAVYGGTYRRRSPALVAEELRLIREQYHPDAIWFVDDVFTISHKWLKEFVDCLREKNVTIPYEIITRADRLNEEVIKLLKTSGCFRVWIGAESGSQKIIDRMDRRVKVEEVREMILLAKKHGIEAGTFIMLGYPGETKEDIRQTIQHLRLSDPDHYTVTIAYPIKGTALYNEIEKEIFTGYDFSVSTDRDIDFKRIHSKNYYKYAVRWVYNEVNYKKEQNRFRKLKIRLKADVAQLLMALNR